MAVQVVQAVQAVHLESDAFLVCLNHALSTEKEEVMGLCIGEVSQPTSPARTLPSGLPTSPGGCWPRPGLWRPQAPSAHPWIGHPPCLCSLKASGAFQKPPAVPIKPLGEAGAGEGRFASLASQRHPGKFPKVPGRRRGGRGFPAAPQKRPRLSFFNASRGPIPLP